jgi:hypothetical protein
MEEHAPLKPNRRAIQDPITGFDIGVDHARYGVDGWYFDNADGQFQCVKDGYNHGKKQFPKPTVKYSDSDIRFVRKWLHLRLNAFRRGRMFSPELTWESFKSIDTPVCPILREPFTYGQKLGTDWTIDRINNDAAYAPGNIVCMSARANEAKNRRGTRGCLMASVAAKESSDGIYFELNESQWMRLAYLTALNSTKRGADYGMLPMAIYPPPGVSLVNSYHILQHACIALFFPIRKENYRSTALLKAFKTLGDHNLQKRILKFSTMAVTTNQCCRKRQPNAQFALGDAWATPLITTQWMDLVERMTPTQVLEVITTYSRILNHDSTIEYSYAEEDESWSLNTRGFVTRGDLCASFG